SFRLVIPLCHPEAAAEGSPLLQSSELARDPSGVGPQADRNRMLAWLRMKGSLLVQAVELRRVQADDLRDGALRNVALIGAVLQELHEVHLHRAVGVG